MRSVAAIRHGWSAVTYGARNPVRRVAGLAGCGVVSGIGESLVVVLVVGLVSPGREWAVPLVGDLPGTWSLAWLALAVLGVLAAAHAGTAWISARSARDVQSAVQRQLTEAYLDAPWSVQSTVRTGELQELVTVRAQLLAYGTQEAAQALTSVLNLVVLIVAATVLSPLATAGLAFAVAIVIALSLLLRGVRRRAVRAAADAQSALALDVTEKASLARELRVFGVTEVAKRELAGDIEEAARRHGRMRLAATLTPPLTRDVAVALLVVALAVLVSSGPEDATVLGAAAVLVLRALSHAQSLSSFGTRWTERVDGLERIRHRLAAWRAPAATGARPCPRVSRLVLRDVSFAYADAGVAAVEGADLELRRGELVGVVGRSGAGKSTLAALLLGLLPPTRGEVEVDGAPLAQVDPREWHARTAWVGQEPRLVTGTVAENIRFWREDVDDADVERAAREAGLEGELALDRPVGPAGTALSLGQRQRVAIARALAGRPEVVVLDEPTSALDVQTEEVVREALERLRQDRVVVVIAHRPSTVRDCDRLVILDGGRLSVVDAPERLAAGDAAWLHEALGSAAPERYPGG